MALLAQVSSVAGQNTAVFVAPFDGVILRSVLVNNRDGSATTFKLTFRRTLSAVMRGVARAFIRLPFDKVPSGGGTTIVKKLLAIFDD